MELRYPFDEVINLKKFIKDTNDVPLLIYAADDFDSFIAFPKRIKTIFAYNKKLHKYINRLHIECGKSINIFDLGDKLKDAKTKNSTLKNLNSKLNKSLKLSDLYKFIKDRTSSIQITTSTYRGRICFFVSRIEYSANNKGIELNPFVRLTGVF